MFICLNIYQVIQYDLFFPQLEVTLPSKGSLNYPKKVTKNCHGSLTITIKCLKNGGVHQSENNSGLIKPMNQTNLSSHLPILRSSSFCLASFQNLPRWLTVSIHLSAPRRDCQSLGPCGRCGHETATVLPLCATTLKIDLCLLSQVRWVPLMGHKCSYTSNAVYAYIRVIILPTQRIHFQGQISEPYHTFAFFDPSNMSNLMTPVILLPHRFSLSLSTFGFNLNETGNFTCGWNPIFVATVTLDPSIILFQLLHIPVLIHPS